MKKENWGFDNSYKDLQYLESIKKRFKKLKKNSTDKLIEILDFNVKDLHHNLSGIEYDNMQNFIGYTKDGKNVFDRYNSHLNEHADVVKILPELLSKIEAKNEDFIIRTVDFKRIIGTTDCVTTTKEDIDKGNIFYKEREGRYSPTRFVKNKAPIETTKATAILKKSDDYNDKYILITARIGSKAEPEPRDINAFSKRDNPKRAEKKSKAFWNTHALIGEEEGLKEREERYKRLQEKKGLKIEIKDQEDINKEETELTEQDLLDLKEIHSRLLLDDEDNEDDNINLNIKQTKPVSKKPVRKKPILKTISQINDNLY